MLLSLQHPAIEPYYNLLNLHSKMKETSAPQTQNNTQVSTLSLQKTPDQQQIDRGASNRGTLRNPHRQGDAPSDDASWQQLQKFVNAHSDKLRDFFQEEHRLSVTEANFSWMRLGQRLGHYLGKTDWPCLENISLVENNLGPEGAELLVKCRWQKVELIDLRSNQLRDQGLRHLVKGDWPRLQNISLNNNEITGCGMQYLKTCNWFNIKQLNLSGNRLGSEGMRALSKMDLQLIDTLELRNCGLGCESLRLMVRAHWPEMILLNITMNVIGDEGVRILAKSSWPKLQYIELQYNQIRHGLRLLRGRWPEMKFPYLYGNKAHVQMIETTVEALVVKLPPL